MSDCEGGDSDTSRPTVSELVRSFVSPSAASEAENRQDKRGRSVSGETTAPPSKRLPPVTMSPQPGTRADLREFVDNAVEKLETSLTSMFSKEFHEFRGVIHEKLRKLEDRLIELEVHVNERDEKIEELSRELDKAKQEISALGTRAEKAEMNSRISCLILSGRAMAPSSAARRPLAETSRSPQAVPGRPAGGDRDLDLRSGSADRTGRPLPPVSLRSADGAGGEHGSVPGSGGTGGAGRSSRQSVAPGAGEEEDISHLVISALQTRMPGLDLEERDIDRAHRLPGPNNRVIVKFVQSGVGSKRDQLLSRRTELRGYNDLFVNESLTAQNGQIFRALLQAKKDKKIYTVFTRGGVVFCKTDQYSARVRVDSVAKLADLGFRVG